MTSLHLPPAPKARSSRRPKLWIAAAVGVLLLAIGWVVVINASAGSTPRPSGVGTAAANGCTIDAAVGSIPPVKAGDVVCLSGTSPSPLVIRTGGTPGRPVTYSGGGTVTVRGIDVEASNVTVQGFTSYHGDSMGAKLLGNNIIFQNNMISRPVYTGDDTDGIRFFGDGIKIVRNTISDVNDGSDCTNQGCDNGPHPDCFQTFYSDSYPTSSNVVIESNRCENVAAQCLMAEGPVLPGDGIDGPGQSANWVFTNNYCDDGANQALMIKDIKNISITNNDFEGTNHKAIALADASTGAYISGNRVNPRIGKLITFDDGNESSGYRGPQPDN